MDQRRLILFLIFLLLARHAVDGWIKASLPWPQQAAAGQRSVADGNAGARRVERHARPTGRAG